MSGSNYTYRVNSPTDDFDTGVGGRTTNTALLSTITDIGIDSTSYAFIDSVEEIEHATPMDEVFLPMTGDTGAFSPASDEAFFHPTAPTCMISPYEPNQPFQIDGSSASLMSGTLQSSFHDEQGQEQQRTDSTSIGSYPNPWYNAQDLTQQRGLNDPTEAALNHYQEGPSTRSLSISIAIPQQVLGLILNSSSGGHLYSCHFPSCDHRTFARLQELKRHHTAYHLTPRPEFWCPISWCDRSAQRGLNPFPRKDKRDEHHMRVHGAALGDVSSTR